MTDVQAGAAASRLAELRRRLMTGLESGEPVVLADARIPVPRPAYDAVGDPSVSTPAPETLPATVLREVLTDRSLHQTADPRGLTIRGAVIDGVLDLDHLSCPYPLALTDCVFTQHVQAEQAHLHSLAFAGTRIEGANKEGNAAVFDEIQVDGSLSLNQGFEAAGAIRLTSAHVGGQLVMQGARINGSDKDGGALSADGLRADGAVFLDGGFQATGALRLVEAQIMGPLSLRGAVIGTDADGAAIVADRLQAGSDLYLDGLSAGGLVRLPDAQISGRLSLTDAKLNHPDDQGNCLSADMMRADGGLFLDGAFEAAGAVRLSSARIAIEVNLRGAQLTGKDTDGSSVIADNLRADGALLLDQGFAVAGSVRLGGAQVAKQLSLRGAKIKGADAEGVALAAGNLEVASDLFLDGFEAAGAIWLVAAHVAGQLSLRGAQLTGDADAYSLVADSLRVDGELFLDGGFKPAGPIRLRGAKVGVLQVGARQLPRLGDANGWRLSDVQGVIRDHRRAARDWLDGQFSFAAQPWEAFAVVYDQIGQPADARRMRYWCAVRSTRYGPGWFKPGRWAYRITTGHGYYPWLAAIWLALLFAVAYGITAGNHDQFTTATTATIREDPATRAHATADGASPGDPLPGRVPAAWCTTAWDTPCLNDLSYTFSTALPATAGQTQAWQPPADTVAGLQVATWLQILRTLAWILTALLLAGVTGLLRKQT